MASPASRCATAPACRARRRRSRWCVRAAGLGDEVPDPDLVAAHREPGQADRVAPPPSTKAYAGATTQSKYVMFYESTPQGLALAPQHIAAHRDRLDQFCRRGTLLMAGPLADGTGRALGVFTTQKAAEDFIAGDPFVLHGVVARWTIVEWKDVLF